MKKNKEPKVRFVITNVVRDSRKLTGETQQELADAVGTTRQTIGKVEKGETPEFWLALALAFHLKKPVEELFIATPYSASPP
ncbi:helix-turn-helix transcriptional regulator [Paenibacillus sp. Leaf72]|uniref:helix-turn-helix transcriptional regulator n=1 Tax=Paenibacillus sp. Leaf72 TaxID=1736234 RepID=UPI0006F8BB5D|nr:helix-turn-helix domain-containing protein [Paenibacillus sp. Leaf72]KQN97044.1 hypothetical protein ASF12_23530 [Paenibacillus sp. Leaf72]